MQKAETLIYGYCLFFLFLMPNAHIRAASISTHLLVQELLQVVGVNALTWAYSISTRTSKQIEEDYKMCQCPYTGYIHFYMDILVIVTDVMLSVNTLQRADSISTASEYGLEEYTFKMCQCPYTGFSISTLPFWNPLFIRV